jgi:hypothetical protein
MTRRIIIINEFARTLDIREGLQQVPVHALQKGDILSGNGESVVSVQRGVRTPSGKSEIILEKNGYRRLVLWGSHTRVAVQTRSSPSVPPERSEDATPKSFWSYQASSETPSLEEAIRIGAISPKTTQVEWDRLSPGFKREIVRSKNKNKDGVGTPEEVAYGEGWHSTENANPYTNAAERASWERGRAARKQKFRMNQHSANQGPLGAGMKRKVGFEPPKKRIADFKSEKGYVAKLIDVKTGSTLARSEPHISNGEGLKKWILSEAQKLIARGKRVKAEISVEFFDPDRM